MENNRNNHEEDSPSILERFLWGGVACGVVALATVAALFWWEFLTPLNRHIVTELPQGQMQAQSVTQQSSSIPATEPNSLPTEDPQGDTQAPPADSDVQEPAPDSEGQEVDVTPPADDSASDAPAEPSSTPSNTPADTTTNPPTEPNLDINTNPNNNQSNAGASSNSPNSSSGGGGNNESGIVLNPSNGNDTGAGTSSATANTSSSSGNSGNTASNNADSGGSGNTSDSANISQPESNTINYVLNWNTMRFHYPSCYEVSKIKDENREDYSGTREEVTDMDFVPCKKCNP